jgi:hypothetical protein
MAEVSITVVSSELEAEILCGLLRTEGIKCYSRETSPLGRMYGLQIGGVEVVVNAEDAQRAGELIAAKP